MTSGRSSNDDARRRGASGRQRVPGASGPSRAPRARRTGAQARPGRTVRSARSSARGAASPTTARPARSATSNPASRRRQAPARTGGRPPQERRRAPRSGGRPTARPARRQPAQPRYWLRRLLVLVIAVALLGAVSYAILSAAVWARDTIREQDAQEAAQSVGTVYPDPVACTPEQVEVAVNAPTSVAAGAGLSIEATITNTGSVPCLLDVGGQSLGAVITSGGVGQWSSLDCPAEPAQRLLLVDAGQSTTTTLYWDGRVSSGQCSPVTPVPLVQPSPTAQEGEDGAEDPVSAESTEDGADGADGSEGSDGAEADATETPQAVDPMVATEGTYVLRLELGGTAITGDHVFTIG